MRVLSAFLLLVTLAVFANSVSVHANDEPATGIELTPFNAGTFFAGEWEVYRHTISYGSSSVNYDNSLPVARWNLERENTTVNLFGRGWLNGSESDAFALKVEFHDLASGKFQSGSDEDNLSTLFDFSFTQIKGSIPVSLGAWNGAEIAAGNEATYVFQASSPDRFTILITPKSADLAKAAQATGKAPKKPVADDDEDLSSAGPASTGHPVLSAVELTGHDSYLLVGHRIKQEGEKTFFQKYGTMFLLGAMLLVNIYMRTKQSATSFTAKQSATRASTVPASNPSRLAGKKPTSATIEEIDEGTINVKKDK